MKDESGRWLRGAAPEKVAQARRLRSEMTPTERALWALVRRDALGHRVRRQHVVLGWIVDFFIPSAGLVIEVDGPIHDTQQDEDARRADDLNASGLRVLRVKNDEIEGAPQEVLARLRDALRHADRSRPEASARARRRAR